MNLSPWFCKNPSTSHFHKKLHSPTDKLTSKNLTAKQGALHKTLKQKFVFHLFVSFRLFRFVCFVSSKIEIPHDGIPHSCNMTASKILKCVNHRVHALKPHFPPIFLTLTTTARNPIAYICQIYHTAMGHRYFNLATTSDICLRYAHAAEESAFASQSPIPRDDRGTLS